MTNHQLSNQERSALRKAVGLPYASNVPVKILIEDSTNEPALVGLPCHWTHPDYPGKRLLRPIWYDATPGDYMEMIIEGAVIKRGNLVHVAHRAHLKYVSSTRRVTVGRFWLAVWRDWQSEDPANKKDPFRFFQRS